MKDRNIKLEAITPNALVVGVDIAKETQWARFVNYRGLELGKALIFRNIEIGVSEHGDCPCCFARNQKKQRDRPLCSPGLGVLGVRGTCLYFPIAKNAIIEL